MVRTPTMPRTSFIQLAPSRCSRFRGSQRSREYSRPGKRTLNALLVTESPCGHVDQMREFCGTAEPQEHRQWASIMLDLHMVIATSSDWKPSSTAAKSVDLRRLPHNRMERSITGLTGSSPCANLACSQSRIVEPLLTGMLNMVGKATHHFIGHGSWYRERPSPATPPRAEV